MASKVYFTDLRANSKQNLLDKLEKLFDIAGFNDVFTQDELVAFKIHFGERGNTGYIRPQFIRRLVDKVKNQGGKPFLTDANTLYVGSRTNAIDHLQTAIENGFDYAVVNAPLIIADGLTGKDYINVLVNLKHLKEVKLGAAAVHANAMFAVSHFKGHELTGFGGALKNVGMGLGSRSGKQIMHSDVLPQVNNEKCTGCQRCSKWCPAKAIIIQNKKAKINNQLCIGCGECTVTCTFAAIDVNWKTKPEDIQEKIVEYAYGVLKNKKGKVGYISFINNISPECDCTNWTDAPVVRDIGIVASLDPIAIDQACVDLVNKEPVLPGCRLDGQNVQDKFRALWPKIDWSHQLRYGEEIGLGSRNYELIKIK